MSDAVRYLDGPPATADLVIVGGGVVGASTAFHAARAGMRPLLLERRAALCTLTTPASTGAYRLQFDNREELELVRESVDLFLHFRERTGQDAYDLGVRRQGYLWLTTDEEGAARQRQVVERQRAWGQEDIELLGGDEVRSRFPYVGPEVLQARFRADDGFIDPRSLTMGLVVGSGSGVVVDCGVTGFRMDGDRMLGVETTRGSVDAGAVVIAAGPFSGVLAGRAGVELPVVTVPRYKVVLPEVPEVPSRAPMTIDEDTGAHWRPALRGAYLLFTDPAARPTPPTEDVLPDHRFAFQLLHPDSPVGVARVAPFWREVWERNRALWLMQAGQYTITPDHRPLLGPAGPEGLFVNGGYSGHGIMGAAAGSRILVDVIRGEVADRDNPFRVEREFLERERDVL